MRPEIEVNELLRNSGVAGKLTATKIKKRRDS